MKNLRFATRLLSGFCLVKREIVKNSQKNIEKYFSKLYENYEVPLGYPNGFEWNPIQDKRPNLSKGTII
ncbi:hypothetical protein Sjap_004549 [Stephania japonica]|uniref:Uncharacterized protein n=1 Tax=Stephania japonica TaxID=461633 RepID=A0AAP0K2F9_9MAGN